VVSGILSALDRGRSGERYILGGENLTYRELAQRAATALGLRRRFLPAGPLVTAAAHLLIPGFSYTRHYIASQYQFYSSQKAGQVLGYRPQPFTNILEGYIAFRERRKALQGVPEFSTAPDGNPADIL
jgi:nucleoside-diphosphate-sugar epimerase